MKPLRTISKYRASPRPIVVTRAAPKPPPREQPQTPMVTSQAVMLLSVVGSIVVISNWVNSYTDSRIKEQNVLIKELCRCSSERSSRGIQQGGIFTPRR